MPPLSVLLSDHGGTAIQTYNKPGPKDMSLKVTDSNGYVYPYSANCSVTIMPAITSNMYCFPSASTAPVGSSITWTVTGISGGIPPYTYTWNDLLGPAYTGSSPTLTRTYNNEGTENMQLTIRDSAGTVSTFNNCRSAVTIGNISTLIPSITSFNTIPNIVNKGGSCHIFGTLDPGTINASTTCSVDGGGLVSVPAKISLSDGVISNASVPFVDNNVQTETNYTLTCVQPDNPLLITPVTKVTRCKINPSMTEGN